MKELDYDDTNILFKSNTSGLMKENQICQEQIEQIMAISLKTLKDLTLLEIYPLSFYSQGDELYRPFGIQKYQSSYKIV